MDESTHKTVIDGKVMCKCGREPYMQKDCCSSGAVYYRVQCPSCGDKGAEHSRSELMAACAWEERNWSK